MKTKFFSAVLAAMMLATASVGVTAYAEEMVETTKSSSAADNETDIPTETTSAAEKIPDFYGDPYYDTDGNASLIKSEQIRQFVQWRI